MAPARISEVFSTADGPIVPAPRSGADDQERLTTVTHARRMPLMSRGFVVRLLINAAALWVASRSSPASPTRVAGFRNGKRGTADACIQRRAFWATSTDRRPTVCVSGSGRSSRHPHCGVRARCGLTTER
jgi:hypothetical protein